MQDGGDHYEGHPTVEYSSGKALMKHGHDVLHDHISSKLEAGLGRGLPQMEVRFKNLSITAQVVVSNDDDNFEHRLPTMATAVLDMFTGFSAKKTTVTKHILKNVNGVFHPGTMTLVLGQPGSGKSSLMKILSGRFPLGKNCTLEGEMLYNGAGSQDVRKRLAQFVSYVTQRDVHFPTLTVAETLAFAHECCGGDLSKHAAEHYNNGTDKENREALEAARAWIKHYPEVIIQQLGLDVCENTIVGDAMTRGVSGGERKRVTMGEMQFGNKAVSFMDEISTGLDSAATYDIVKTQLSLARKLRKTIVISLLQPSPEVFELFDYVMILNQGRVIYHGPQSEALGYFETLGFVCPPDRDVADFLMDIGTHEQFQYESGLPPGSSYPHSVAELAEAYERSAIHEEMLTHVHAPHDPQLIKDREDFFDNMPQFHQSFWSSVMTLTRQQSKVLWRNTPFIASRAAMAGLMALVNGSVFWQIDPKQAQIVQGVLFQALLFLGFGQFTQIPTFFAARQVFYKQRAANFYSSAAYVVAFSINQVPLAIAEALVFGSIVYWMCGLVASAPEFIIFELVLFVTSTTMTSLFFLTSCCLPNFMVANPLSLMIACFIALYSGFAISESQIPDALVWIYWLNPFSWGTRALAVNQFRADKFNVNVYDGIDYFGLYGKTMGEYSLDLVGMRTDKSWIALEFVFQIGTWLLMLVLSTLFLEFVRFELLESSGVAADEPQGQQLTQSKGPSTDPTSDYALASTPRSDDSKVAVLKTSHDHRITPVTLAFKDLWYTVPNPQNPKEGLDLLRGISGYAMPGKITALMGSSGAGKTTLMDVIAARKTGGKIQGQILLNGFEATPLAIQRSTGYCEQMDIHSESSTFREALQFSAFLRQDQRVPDSEKYDWVEECLDLLGLRPIADKIIRGSSVEQMKRLTIGVEMAARPSVLFLDEPTSGLDARAAKLVMDSVRLVANTGVTVVCTIHQPSFEVFQVFDSLLLLKRGGYTVYFGDLGKNAIELVSYLESIDGVAPLEKDYNPATWMLEVIGAGVGNTANDDKDFADIFSKSTKKALMDENLTHEGVTRPLPGASPLVFTKKRAASDATQARLLIRRVFDMYWRTPSYNLTRAIIQLFLGLLFGVSYVSLSFETIEGITGGVAMIFMMTVFTGFITFSGAIPMVLQDRAAFYRERASQTYNVVWYFVALMLVEIPYVSFSTFFFTITVFPLVGFEGVPEFFFFWLNVALFALVATYGGMSLGVMMPSMEVAMGMGALFHSLFALFTGFNPPATAIPTGYKWLFRIAPYRYSLEALATIVFGNCDASHPERIACKKIENPPPTLPQGLTAAEYIKVMYDMDYDHVWRNVLITVGYCLLFGLLTLRALRFVNHQTR